MVFLSAYILRSISSPSKLASVLFILTRECFRSADADLLISLDSSLLGLVVFKNLSIGNAVLRFFRIFSILLTSFWLINTILRFNLWRMLMWISCLIYFVWFHIHRRIVWLWFFRFLYYQYDTDLEPETWRFFLSILSMSIHFIIFIYNW